MTDEKMYTIEELCEELKVSSHTITSWYRWEKKAINNGDVDTPYLPTPIRLNNVSGRPRRWTGDMLDQLRNHQHSIVRGRNGSYGVYSNPNHKNTNKYIKEANLTDSEPLNTNDDNLENAVAK